MMIPARVLSQRLVGRAQIAATLSKPTWSAGELFQVEQNPATESDQKSISAAPTAELLDKLLKQAGLPQVKSNPDLESKLLGELEKQLNFVQHIAAVDTEGLDPLVRISGPPLETSMDLIMDQPSVASETQGEGWKPTELAAEKNGDFFILHEGLRKDVE